MGTPGALSTPGRGGAWFAGLSFTNEREFMMAFRDLVFAYGREQSRAPAPPIAPDQLRAIMQDLMLLERELLWLFIKGYDARHIAAIMMNAAVTAEAVQRVAGERLQAVLLGSTPTKQNRLRWGLRGCAGGSYPIRSGADANGRAVED